MDFEQTTQARWTVLAVTGRVDAHTAPDFEAGAGKALDAGAKFLALDLSGVPYLSSAGLRVLLALHKKLAASGGGLAVVAPVPAVKEVLDISGFSTLLKVLASVSDLP